MMVDVGSAPADHEVLLKRRHRGPLEEAGSAIQQSELLHADNPAERPSSCVGVRHEPCRPVRVTMRQDARTLEGLPVCYE